MKKIIISIKPEWVALILKKEKTLEIRKTMPRCELPVEVYIYCTKGEHLWANNMEKPFLDRVYNRVIDPFPNFYLNKRVVAKFTLNNVDEYEVASQLYEQNSVYRKKDNYYMGELQSSKLNGLLEKSKLSNKQLEDYIGTKETFYAWNIDNLEIFEKPKELREFGTEKAPQSWCYIKE